MLCLFWGCLVARFFGENVYGIISAKFRLSLEEFFYTWIIICEEKKLAINLNFMVKIFSLNVSLTQLPFKHLTHQPVRFSHIQQH